MHDATNDVGYAMRPVLIDGMQKRNPPRTASMQQMGHPTTYEIDPLQAESHCEASKGTPADDCGMFVPQTAMYGYAQSRPCKQAYSWLAPAEVAIGASLRSLTIGLPVHAA